MLLKEDGKAEVERKTSSTCEMGKACLRPRYFHNCLQCPGGSNCYFLWIGRRINITTWIWAWLLHWSLLRNNRTFAVDLQGKNNLRKGVTSKVLKRHKIRKNLYYHNRSPFDITCNKCCNRSDLSLGIASISRHSYTRACHILPFLDLHVLPLGKQAKSCWYIE